MAPPRRELQGPKPPPLTVNKGSWKVKKNVPVAPSSGAADPRNPVIIYVRTPRIIHATPQEFMSLVQSLTGKDSRPSRCSSDASNRSGVSRLVEVNGTNSGNEEVGRCSGSSNSSSNSGGEVDVDPLLLTLGQVPFTPSDPSVISPSFLFCSPTTKRLLQEFSTLL